jgi:ribosomal protein S18 acetylase RimI-like enzyme
LEKDFHLMVKIGEDNQSSVKLFESLGFVKLEEKANYFGELELIVEGNITEEWTKGLVEKYGVEGYEEMAYVPQKVET